MRVSAIADGSFLDFVVNEQKSRSFFGEFPMSHEFELAGEGLGGGRGSGEAFSAGVGFSEMIVIEGVMSALHDDLKLLIKLALF